MMLQGRFRITACAVILTFACGVTPALAAHDFFGVSSRGTTAVAVGDSGRILYSPQSPHTTWFKASSIVAVPLRAVTTSSTGYVAAGDVGRIYRNGDGTGLVWSIVSSHTSLDLHGIDRVGSRIVAVGDSGTIRIGVLTADQFPWSPADSVGTQRSLRAVAGGQSYAVAVGDSGTVLWAASVSASIWKPVTTIPTSVDLDGVVEGPNHRFWAVGKGGMILRSLPSPSEPWQRIGIGITASDLHAVAFFGLLGVAVGDGGTILYSNGGDVWVRVDAPTTEDLHAVAYTGSGQGGGFVAVGDRSTILFSVTGTNWLEGTVPIRSTSWGSIRAGWRTPAAPSPPKKR